MPIVKDINVMRNELARPENKELADLIKREVHYAVVTRPRLANQDYLIDVVTYNLFKLYNEYPMMVDSRNGDPENNNNNDQPF